MRSPASSTPIIFIIGPTAIGKTGLAIELARCINGEIISADSMQIYKGMRILSQAPTPEERRKARHHLTELLNPQEEYSVATFTKKVPGIIASIIKRKKIPIVVGGSGLYIRGLIDGLFPSPDADMKFRAKMKKSCGKFGSKKLHSRLEKIDPVSAEAIHPNDERRIIRALELYHSTGKTMTELKRSTRGLKSLYNIKIFGLTRPREEIYAQIEARVDRMFDGRVIEEVKRLRRKKLSKTAAAVLGFNEISGCLEGNYDLDAAKNAMKMNTRRFSKRQLTWFRADSRIKWFDLNKINQARAVSQIAKEAR